ncbi:hypothetical protein EI94DRAFT_1803646 [Lactarius quietus]|nr:hypothetical protein EI94DRAFT_1803646 [Lactarius quietus]
MPKPQPLNTLSPVSSLPPELSAAIFSFLCHPGPSGKPDHHLAPLCVTHVCHQWREIALDLPLLWSVDFPTLSSVGAAVMLARAKSVPLSLEADFRGYLWDDDRFCTFRKEIQGRLPHSSTPRLSWLELYNCAISWHLSLLKGLKYLKILTSTVPVVWRPYLASWLGALDEMPQPKTLTLHQASLIAPPFQFDVVRTFTLPSLTRLDILDSPEDCLVVLSHLDLPALTWLCLTVISSRLLLDTHVDELLRHAAFRRLDILAWPAPNIDNVVHDPPTLLAETLPPRMALSFRTRDHSILLARVVILHTVLVGLPVDRLVTLAAYNLGSSSDESDFHMRHFWLNLLPQCTLLQRVQLAFPVGPRFIETLLINNGGRERPLLPSLTELVVADASLHTLSMLPLYDTLMKRMEQGVPVKMLDLRMCIQDPDLGRVENWLGSLGDIGVNVLGPEKNTEEIEQIRSIWKTVFRVPFINDEHLREDDYSDVSGDSSDNEE